MVLTARVERLHRDLAGRLQAAGRRIDADPDDQRALAEALLSSYQETAGQPPVLRRARALYRAARELPVRLISEDLLAGHQTFTPLSGAGEASRRLGEAGYACSTGHIVHDYEALLERGLEGLRRELREATPTSREQAETQQACELALEAFAVFIQRHQAAATEIGHPLAEDLSHLTHRPPVTFRQALQLVWLIQIFLHVENPSMAISFGRLDQALGPFLAQDLARKDLTEDQAFELVCAFCLKCCEGDESQNLVVGGVDADGHAAANRVSHLLLDAVRELRCHQPSLTVAWHAEAAPEFIEAALQLAEAGFGQPGFINHRTITQALQAAGLPPDRAQDWAIVGCYEACSQGDCYANTVLGGLHLPASLVAFMVTPEAEAAASFGAFVTGWCQYLGEVWEAERQALQARWEHMARHAPSPFGSLLMRGCVRRLQPLEAGGADYNLVGVDILGLGTVVDGLLAIRELVFDEGSVSLTQLAAQVAADFADEILHQRLLHRPGRYGTDSPASNELAGRLSREVATMILHSRLEGGVRPYPGFFRFGADIHDLRGASPDGRREGDFISYGVGPAASVTTTPTAVIASAAHLAHDLCACGNPLALSLPVGERSPALMRSLLETYFAQGGFHLHFNFADAQQLRQARQDPANHAHLLVRVSGFSAPFVRMDERWQEALIERAERGL